MGLDPTYPYLFSFVWDVSYDLYGEEMEESGLVGGEVFAHV